jgi:hypothetical protein
MTPTPRPVDQEAAWLEALAGRPAAELDEPSRQEAERLRRAIAHRKAELESMVPGASEADFERLRERLIVEQPEPSQSPGTVAQDGSQEVRDDTPGRRLPANNPVFRWGIAAALVLATALTVQMGIFDSQEGTRDHEILRGEVTTTQIVENPSVRATELQQLLQRAGAAPVVQPLKDGRVVLRVAATPEVLEALGQQRILPQTKDGQIVLVLEKPATSNSPSR